MGHLTLVNNEFRVHTNPFLRDNFFRKEEKHGMFFSTHFRQRVLKVIPDEVPELQTVFAVYKLTQNAMEYELMRELKDPQPLSPEEFAAFVRHLVHLDQSEATEILNTRGHSNIVTVDVHGARCFVDIGYDPVEGEWDFHLGDSGFEGANKGDLIFVRM